MQFAAIVPLRTAELIPSPVKGFVSPAASPTRIRPWSTHVAELKPRFVNAPTPGQVARILAKYGSTAASSATVSAKSSSPDLSRLEVVMVKVHVSSGPWSTQAEVVGEAEKYNVVSGLRSEP
jgi:hypothetical protein